MCIGHLDFHFCEVTIYDFLPIFVIFLSLPSNSVYVPGLRMLFSTHILCANIFCYCMAEFLILLMVPFDELFNFNVPKVFYYFHFMVTSLCTV